MNILKVVLVTVGVIACFLLFNGPDVNSDPKDVEAFRDGGKLAFASFFTGFVVFLGVGLIILFFIVQLISNPKKTIISILGLIIAFIIYLIFLAVGTSDTNETLQLRTPVDQSTITATGAGLWTVIVAVAVGLLAVIAGFFTRSIK